MPSLFLRNQPVGSVFELIGSNENSLTFALGWVLRQAPSLLTTIANALAINAPDPDSASVILQKHQDGLGYTDVEVRVPGCLAWIVEAKIGFEPPGQPQLAKYASRLNLREDPHAKPSLIVLAQSDRNDMVLKRHVPAEVDGVPVSVLSWGRLLKCCDEAAATTNNTGNEALRQLKSFIRKVLFMRDRESNSVYVVSIANTRWDTIGTTFRKVVTDHARYFHPVAKNWPSTPPNYLGFRWDGQLQSIHHVDDYKVVDNMLGEFPDAIDEKIDPHFIYRLGPAMRPHRPVLNGSSIVMANRVSAALDLLLTSQTITEAMQMTKARQTLAT